MMFIDRQTSKSVLRRECPPLWWDVHELVPAWHTSSPMLLRAKPQLKINSSQDATELTPWSLLTVRVQLYLSK
jgi:hypothetical protein